MPNPHTQTTDYRRGVGPWLWYPCLLVSTALVVAVVGGLLSPVVRGLIVMGVSAYGGFLLALFIAILLGLTDHADSPAPHETRNTLGLGLLGTIIGTALFGPVWLLGFFTYLGVIIAIFWGVKRLKERQRSNK